MKTSTPSSAPKSPKKPGSSTTSWRIPEPTDVIAYAYLWQHEAAEGRDEGSKDRPVVVVLARIEREDMVEIYVAPVTTRHPRHAAEAVEVPATVKAHLGLDDRRSWIVATELNRFIWPGPDIRPIKRKTEITPFYGKIPAKLFERLRKLMAFHAGRIKVTPRSE